MTAERDGDESKHGDGQDGQAPAHEPAKRSQLRLEPHGHAAGEPAGQIRHAQVYSF